MAAVPLTHAELTQLREVDLLLVAGLADARRAQHRGDEVQLLSGAAARAAGVVVFEQTPTAAGATGAELLRELALLRLATPAHTPIAVSIEALGLELAQTALLFGADAFVGDLGNARTLPLLDGVSARKRELAGLVARSGRRANFDHVEPAVTSHTAPVLAEQTP
jgi:2-iminoacetate synthase ThiH